MGPCASQGPRGPLSSRREAGEVARSDGGGLRICADSFESGVADETPSALRAMIVYDQTRRKRGEENTPHCKKSIPHHITMGHTNAHEPARLLCISDRHRSKPPRGGEYP